MKKLAFILMLLCVGLCTATAQESLNLQADNIVGTYSGKQGNDRFRVRIVKLTDGTYHGQVVWMERDKDAQGNKILDRKNPDKKLRSTPADRIVLFSGLKYDELKLCWNGTKIYDPQRGIRAHLSIDFGADGRLQLRGSLMGIGETVYWTRVS